MGYIYQIGYYDVVPQFTEFSKDAPKDAPKEDQKDAP